MGKLCPRTPSPTPTSRSPKLRKNFNPPPPSTPAYYFYQAASGLPIFLHPLDIRILYSYFGASTAFSDCIVVRVEAASEGSVDADLWRRYKYLSHIRKVQTPSLLKWTSRASSAPGDSARLRDDQGAMGA